MNSKIFSSTRFGVLIAATYLIIMSVFQGCVKDSFDKRGKTDWNPNYAIPLVHSTMTLNSILNKDTSGLVRENTTNDKGFLSIVYKANLFSQTASSFLSFPDQSFDVPVVFSAAELSVFDVMPIDSSYKFARSETFALSPDTSIIIDSIFFKTGKIDFAITSGMAHDIDIVINIPSATLNGIPFSQKIAVKYTGIPNTVTSTIDLADYKIDASGRPDHKIDFNYLFTLTKKNGTSTGEINIKESNKNLSFSKLFGDFKNLSLSPGPGNMPISIFANTKGPSNFAIKEIKATMNITNSFGMGIDASLDQLYGTSDLGTFSALAGPVPILINSPGISEVGASVKSSIILDKAHGVDIANIINNKPLSLIYNMTAKTKPKGNGFSNFILDTSRISADMELEIPLEVSANNITFQDTVVFPLTQSVDVLESLLFRANIANGFPFNIGIQVYFVDSLYNKKDSLFNSADPNHIVLLSAVTDASGKVIHSSSKTTDIVFNQAKVKNLATVKKMIVVGSLSTYWDKNLNPTTQPYVKIYSDYKLDLNLGTEAKLKVRF